MTQEKTRRYLGVESGSTDVDGGSAKLLGADREYQAQGLDGLGSPWTEEAQ